MTTYCFSTALIADNKADELVLAKSDTAMIVEHEDPVIVDEQLTLTDLLDHTVQQYPDMQWINALNQEAKALTERGQSWIADSASADLSFEEVTSGTLHILEGGITVPFWNLGQRDAEQAYAQKARLSAILQHELLRLQIAGMLRKALWEIRLNHVLSEQALLAYTSAQKLLDKVSTLERYGELAKIDVLLAKSEVLKKRSQVVQARAELMHARQRYTNLTQTNHIPANSSEIQNKTPDSVNSHIALRAVDSLIDRQQASIDALHLVGSGQSTVRVGVGTDRGHNDERSNKTEFFGIAVNIPFGGIAQLNPKIAAAQVDYNKFIAQRGQLLRALQRELHEAEHNLQVDKVELGIVQELKSIADQHLKMAELSFSAGETTLLDLIRIQSSTQQARLKAKQRAVMLQRDIALYNQAVGQLP
ncbi:MAG: TolC family protein [Gammaproteobacteria bacterium]|nr:TolC family protein [Gammaproteobacteria bacterium]